MDPIRRRELKRQAFMRLAAQRRRAGLLRGRVVVLSLLCFVVLWGIVFAQMATGNDPVLGAKEKTVAARASSSAGRSGGNATRRELEPVRKTDSSEAEAAEPVEEEAAEEVLVEAEPESTEEEPLVTSQS